MVQSSKAGSTGPAENHDKPGIQGLLRGFWTSRCDQLGWTDRLMQQCLQECYPDGDALAVGYLIGTWAPVQRA